MPASTPEFLPLSALLQSLVWCRRDEKDSGWVRLHAAWQVASVLSNCLQPYGPSPIVPLSVGFSRQEYCSGLSCPFQAGIGNLTLQVMNACEQEYIQVCGTSFLISLMDCLWQFNIIIVQSLGSVRLFATPWTAACQATLSFTISWSLLKLMPTELVMPSNHHIIYHPLLLCPRSFSASESFPMSRLFTWGGQSIGASVSIFPMNIQGWLPLGLTDWSPCCPGDFQKSSPAPQFVSINFALLNLLYGPTITSVHDYKKTVALTIWIFGGKSDVSVF